MDEVRREVPNPGDFVSKKIERIDMEGVGGGGILDEDDSRTYEMYGFSQFFRISEFNGGFNKKPIQLTVDYFFIRSNKIIRIIKDRLREVEGVKLCSPIESSHCASCGYENTLCGTISFSVERGLHPVTILRDVIDSVNKQYDLDIQFVVWKPYVDSKPVLKDVGYRTVDGLVA